MDLFYISTVALGYRSDGGKSIHSFYYLSENVMSYYLTITN